MGEFSLMFMIRPVPKQRPRLSRHGGVFTPKETVQFENAVKLAARAQFKGEPLTCPLGIELELVFKRPKKASKPYPRGDVDNYCKAILDSLNEIIYKNDAQIVALGASKRYGEADYIAMNVILLDPKDLVASENSSVPQINSRILT